MILKSIILENYRPYVGPEKIVFATGEKNITIIEGNNDRGKTCLLNAFTWCFYGKESYRKEGNEPLYNKSAMDSLNIGDSLFVRVTIKMCDNNNRDIRLIRTEEFLKNNSQKAQSIDSKFEIFRYNENNEEEKILITDNFINSHLPEDLRQYFLFDGEQLIQFLDNDNSMSIKNGVYTLSQMDLLKNLDSHIKQRRNEFTNQIKLINPDLGNNQIKLNKLEENKENDEKKLVINKREIEKNKKDIELHKKEIKEFGENPKNIQNEIENINYECENIKEELKVNRDNLIRFLVNNFNNITAIPALNHFMQITETLEENKYIPSPFKKDFLEDLLKDKKCICGTEFTEDSDCYKELLKLFENTDEVTNLSDEVNILRGKVIKTIHNYPIDFKENLTNFYNNKIQLEKDLEYKNTLLKTQKMKLERLNIDKINELNEKIDRKNNTINNLLEENGILKHNINKIYPNQIKELKLKIKKSQKEQDKLDILNKKIEFCKNIINYVKNIKNKLAIEIHDQLEQITSEEFKNIHWKETYKRVLISDDFDITFEKEDGSILKSTDPSSGTQLVLALSFMIALNSLSGFKLPLIIDTPLGRLDEDVSENIAEFLPEFIKDKQVAFFVTDKEYNGEFKNKIKPFVGKEYHLQYFNDEFGEYTKVI